MGALPARVVLIGNYEADQQASMQAFATLLERELWKRDIQAEIIKPAQRWNVNLIRKGPLGKWFGYIDKLVLFPQTLKTRIRERTGRDVFHICDHSNAVYTRMLQGIPHLVTCHDLLAVRSALGEIPENRTGRTGRLYQRMILDGLNRAGRVACVSSATRRDLLRMAKLGEDQVGLVPNGLNYPYRPMERTEAMRRIEHRLGGGKRFILHVGGNQWYKNRAGVVGIYGELLKMDPDAPILALVGKPWTDSLRAQIEKIAPKRIVGVHNAESEDLRAFYSAAELFLFPSLMEGFGWPVIEAQACGAAVITTNREPMTEAGGGAAIYVDPRDWRAAAETARQLLAESATAKNNRKQASIANAARFSTAQMIDGYLEQYSRVLNRA